MVSAMSGRGGAVNAVAESNLTKKVLAQTFKELVCSQSFEKVGVSDICQACQVSRKTFYYHFQDKYDLAEWIFDTEFIAVMRRSDVRDRWSLIQSLLEYFYRERVFYAQLLRYRGQNSFGQYFQEFLMGVLEPFILPESSEIDAIADQDGVMPEAAQTFYAHFITDALLMAIFRWLVGGATPGPEELVQLLKTASDLITARVNRRDETDKLNDQSNETH